MLVQPSPAFSEPWDTVERFCDRRTPSSPRIGDSFSCTGSAAQGPPSTEILLDRSRKRHLRQPRPSRSEIGVVFFCSGAPVSSIVTKRYCINPEPCTVRCKSSTLFVSGFWALFTAVLRWFFLKSARLETNGTTQSLQTLGLSRAAPKRLYGVLGIQDMDIESAQGFRTGRANDGSP